MESHLDKGYFYSTIYKDNKQLHYSSNNFLGYITTGVYNLKSICLKQEIESLGGQHILGNKKATSDLNRIIERNGLVGNKDQVILRASDYLPEEDWIILDV